jgi:hypothetical protein
MLSVCLSPAPCVAEASVTALVRIRCAADVGFEWLESYDEVDNHARAAEPRDCSSIAALSKYLCGPFRHSERLQFRAIFAWICFVCCRQPARQTAAEYGGFAYAS